MTAASNTQPLIESYWATGGNIRAATLHRHNVHRYLPRRSLMTLYDGIAEVERNGLAMHYSRPYRRDLRMANRHADQRRRRRQLRTWLRSLVVMRLPDLRIEAWGDQQ